MIHYYSPNSLHTNLQFCIYFKNKTFQLNNNLSKNSLCVKSLTINSLIDLLTICGKVLIQSTFFYMYFVVAKIETKSFILMNEKEFW